MAPRTKKQQEPKAEQEIKVKWFPVYGLKVKEFPHLYLTGRTPEEAMMRLASLMSDEGRRLKTDFRATFVNEPFAIE